MRFLERARKCSPASGNSDRCQRSRTEALWHFRSTRRGTLHPKVVGVRHTRIRRCSTRPRQISQDAQWHPMMRDDPVAVQSTGHPAQCIDRGEPSEATPCSRGRSHEGRAERRLLACGARAISGVLCVQQDREQTRSQWRRLATAPGPPAQRPAIASKQLRRRPQDARSHAQTHTAPGGGGACTRHRPGCTLRAAGSA